MAEMDGSLTQGKANDKMLEQLNRHLIWFAKYKQS